MQVDNHHTTKRPQPYHTQCVSTTSEDNVWAISRLLYSTTTPLAQPPCFKSLPPRHKNTQVSKPSCGLLLRSISRFKYAFTSATNGWLIWYSVLIERWYDLCNYLHVNKLISILLSTYPSTYIYFVVIHFWRYRP